MTAAVEHTVEVDRVEFPARRDGRYIFVQSCDQGNMARARLGWHACMRYSKGAVFEDAGAQVGGKMAWLLVGGGGGVRIGEGLEGFVGAEAIAWSNVSFVQ